MFVFPKRIDNVTGDWRECLGDGEEMLGFGGWWEWGGDGFLWDPFLEVEIGGRMVILIRIVGLAIGEETSGAVVGGFTVAVKNVEVFRHCVN